MTGLVRRAAVHAALGDPGGWRSSTRCCWGRRPRASCSAAGDAVEPAGPPPARAGAGGRVSRHRSEADRRRTYLALAPEPSTRCVRSTAARRGAGGVRVHPQLRALAAGRRAVERHQPGPGHLGGHPPGPGGAPRRGRGRATAPRPAVPAPPRHVDDVLRRPRDDLVITVCDTAHEELAAARQRARPVADRLHWSIPDPVRTGDDGRVRPRRHRPHRPHRPPRPRRHAPPALDAPTIGGPSMTRLTTAAPTCPSTSSSR